jgi:hypothetical protein
VYLCNNMVECSWYDFQKPENENNVTKGWVVWLLNMWVLDWTLDFCTLSAYNAC